MKIVKYLEEFSLIINVITKTIQNRSNEQKNEFVGMLLGILAASLLGKVLAGKGDGEGMIAKSQE